MPGNIKPIKVCRSCHSKNLKKVLDLGELALSDFTRKPVLTKTKYPLTLLLCLDCNLVQLKHSIPPQKLYTERYGYRSGINKTMRDELSLIVNKATERKKLKKGNLVIDIGANDGILLSFYPQNVRKLAVEPVKKFAKECLDQGNLVVSDYFSRKNIQEAHPKIGKAKIITAISMFYDLEDPNFFLRDVKKMLDQSGIFIIQQNYLLSMLKMNAFDNIVHEHIEYYSLRSLNELLRRNGLRVFDIELSKINGGSFRTYISHIDSVYPNSFRVKKFQKEELRYKLDKKNPYDSFARRVKKIRTKLREYVENEVQKGNKVYLYGASTRGNTILQYCGLNNKLISAAVERNPEKWGKFIASVDIPIISEEQARKDMPPNMLVLPWFFREEFLRRERHYLERGGKFIFPLPLVKVVKIKS